MSRRFEVRSGKDLGRAVAAARVAARRDRADVAGATGLSVDYLAKIENGRTTPLLEHELRILRRLGARVIVELPTNTEREETS